MSSLTSIKNFHSRAMVVRPRRSARMTVTAPVRAFQMNDVGEYLSKAAEQIFHPMQESDVPWEKSSSAFSGAIAHHEEPRVRAPYEAVKTTRKSIESAAPSAPEAIEDVQTFQFDDKGELVTVDGSLHQYVTDAIERVFGHNFKGDENEPKEYFGSGYPASGRRSSRDLAKDVDKLRRFEMVIKQTLQKE